MYQAHTYTHAILHMHTLTYIRTWCYASLFLTCDVTCRMRRRTTARLSSTTKRLSTASATGKWKDCPRGHWMKLTFSVEMWSTRMAGKREERERVKRGESEAEKELVRERKEKKERMEGKRERKDVCVCVYEVCVCERESKWEDMVLMKAILRENSFLCNGAGLKGVVYCWYWISIYSPQHHKTYAP